MMVGGRAAHTVGRSDQCGGTDGLLVLIYFRVPEWRMRVRCPHTKVVTIATTTTATRRWTGGTRGRWVRSVWGSGGCAFVAHAPKSSPSPPLPPPLVGGRVARAVDGLDRCGGTDGLLILIYFWVPEWWMRIRCPRTKVVAIAATTTATRRWMGGTRGQWVGSVWESGQPARPHLFQGARVVDACSSPTHQSHRRRCHYHRHS
jgi:hypothetical protein